MRNYVSVVILFVLTTIIFSCSKDNRSAKKLDGIWTLSSYTIDIDSIVDLTGITFTINLLKCKTTKEWCAGSETLGDGNTSAHPKIWA